MKPVLSGAFVVCMAGCTTNVTNVYNPPAGDSATDSSEADATTFDSGATSDAGADTASGDTAGDVDGATVGDGAADVSADADVLDEDGDGYPKAIDCNDKDPMINPGAFDVPGDGVDNDCSGTADDEPTNCDGTVAMGVTDAMKLAKVLGLCRATTPAATGKDRTWGVISGSLTTIGGSPTVLARQTTVRSSWGSVIGAREGTRMFVMSTGAAYLPGEVGYMKPLDLLLTSNTTNEDALPAGWPRNTALCPKPTSTTGNDSVALKLKIRAPTNAKAFSFEFDQFFSEYIDYSCSPYNDGFAVFLASKLPLDPKFAGSIVATSTGDPLNVNSAFVEVCTAGTSKNLKVTYTCPKGRGELAGTGYDDGSSDKQHASTSWLSTSAPISPGEEFEITFAIWNSGDHMLQSAVLLDRWRWSTALKSGPETARPL